MSIILKYILKNEGTAKQALLKCLDENEIEENSI